MRIFEKKALAKTECFLKFFSFADCSITWAILNHILGLNMVTQFNFQNSTSLSNFFPKNQLPLAICVSPKQQQTQGSGECQQPLGHQKTAIGRQLILNKKFGFAVLLDLWGLSADACLLLLPIINVGRIKGRSYSDKLFIKIFQLNNCDFYNNKK